MARRGKGHNPHKGMPITAHVGGRGSKSSRRGHGKRGATR